MLRDYLPWLNSVSYFSTLFEISKQAHEVLEEIRINICLGILAEELSPVQINIFRSTFWPWFVKTWTSRVCLLIPVWITSRSLSVLGCVWTENGLLMCFCLRSGGSFLTGWWVTQVVCISGTMRWVSGSMSPSGPMRCPWCLREQLFITRWGVGRLGAGGSELTKQSMILFLFGPI